MFTVVTGGRTIEPGSDVAEGGSLLVKRRCDSERFQDRFAVSVREAGLGQRSEAATGEDAADAFFEAGGRQSMAQVGNPSGPKVIALAGRVIVREAGDAG